MKSIIHALTASALAVLFSAAVSTASVTNDTALDLEQQGNPLSGAEIYSSLTGLLIRVSEDASTHFDDFFGPSAVHIKPFSVLGEFGGRKTSLLGATLADQMRAMVSNSALSPLEEDFETGGNFQKLSGVIQEMDGFLRVHINGVNDLGDLRSFVVNVEMSESIYRALHTWVR